MLLEYRKEHCCHEVNITNQKRSPKRYHYQVYGLYIVSDILLPELMTAIDMPYTPEVSIRLGTVPVEISGTIETTKSYQASKNQFLFQVPGVARYYVTNGNCIVVEPDEQAEETSLRLFLLGTAFGSLLMQRGILPIHGSAVVINGCCVIFTGVSGAGKSTLLAAFRKQGYSFLTDDVAAVTVGEEGIARVQSAYPQQKLWRDSAETIGLNIVTLTPFYRGISKDKYAVPVHKGFWHKPAPLVAVYELGAERCRDVTFRPLSGVDKLAVLLSHTYRPWLINGLGLKAEHFKQCVAVAGQVAVSRLIRPEGVFCLEEQVRLVQQDMSRLLAGRLIEY